MGGNVGVWVYGWVWVVTHAYLSEGQLLGIGATLADTLLDDAHGKSAMGDAGERLAGITLLG